MENNQNNLNWQNVQASNSTWMFRNTNSNGQWSFLNKNNSWQVYQQNNSYNTVKSNQNVSSKVNISNTLIWNKNVVNSNMNWVNNQKLLINTDWQSNSRFLDIKYKIYTFIIFLILIWWYWYLFDAYQNYQLEVDNYKQKQEYFLTQGEKYKNYLLKKKFIEKVNQQSQQFVNCLDFDNDCDQLDKKILENKNIVKTYFELGKLQDTKMDIDEKKILKNLNEYLLIKNPFAQQKVRNWQFLWLEIWNPKQVQWKLYKVPVKMQIRFPNKDDVLSFLDNVEKKIFYTKLYGFDNAIAYKIDKVNYDIMNYEVSQDVNVELTAFFIKNYNNGK